MLASTASLIDSLSAMTEIFSKAAVIAWCCGHASEAYPLLVGSSCYYGWKLAHNFLYIKTLVGPSIPTVTRVLENMTTKGDHQSGSLRNTKNGFMKE